MKQYINKVVAEIEKTYKFHEKRGNEHDSSICDVLYGLSHRISTLEVKEVDLEKEICNWIGDEESCKDGKWTWYECNKMIRYFFELGLKAQKGE